MFNSQDNLLAFVIKNYIFLLADCKPMNLVEPDTDDIISPGVFQIVECHESAAMALNQPSTSSSYKSLAAVTDADISEGIIHNLEFQANS